MRFQFLKRGVQSLINCVALIAGQDPNFGLLAYDVMVELAIPRNVFVEVLDGFADVRGELIVEMFEHNGERYIRLGETAKYNCVD